MSHFTKNTKVFITDTEAFVKACRELGITGEVKHNTKMRGYAGKTQQVALCIDAGGGYDIGLEKESGKEEKYGMVADWWGVRGHSGNSRFQGLDDEAIQNLILQGTTKHTIKDKYSAMGFDVSEVKDKTTGEVKMTLTRTAGGRWG